jgi:hypothetical protein
MIETTAVELFALPTGPSSARTSFFDSIKPLAFGPGGSKLTVWFAM